MGNMPMENTKGAVPILTAGGVWEKLLEDGCEGEDEERVCWKACKEDYCNDDMDFFETVEESTTSKVVDTTTASEITDDNTEGSAAVNIMSALTLLLLTA